MLNNSSQVAVHAEKGFVYLRAVHTLNKTVECVLKINFWWCAVAYILCDVKATLKWGHDIQRSDFSKMGLFATLIINDIQHNVFIVIILSVAIN